ncbi:MAG: alpha/beta hydrolase [Myxococcota bacterium]
MLRALKPVFRHERMIQLIGFRRRRAAPALAADIATLLTINDFIEKDAHDVEPAVARRQTAASARLSDIAPSIPVETRDLDLESRRGPVSVRLYSPAGVAMGSPGIAYLHGGGWVVCSVSTHDIFCRRLAVETGCRIASIRYRLAPEAPFPAAVDDSVEGFRAVKQHAATLGIDPSRLAVGGDSAGGNLSAVVAQRLAGTDEAPALQLLIYPAVDATLSFPSIDRFADGFFLTKSKMLWYRDHYAQGADLRDPDLSPYYREDVRGVAPALVYTAGFDPLRDEGMAYAEKLRAAGVPTVLRNFDDQVHAFINMAGLVPSAARAVSQIADDARRALHAPRAFWG